MNILEGLEKTIKAILTQARLDKVVGPIKIKSSVNGNKEAMQDKFIEVAKKVSKEMGFTYHSIFVIYDDDGFTSIRTSFLDNETIMEYVSLLEKREKVRQNPRQMLNAFNKALTIADHFNNMFGEGIHNKSKELNEINDIYDLIKDVYQK